MTFFVGLGGYAESGKDTVADMLVDLGNWRKRRMSEPFEVGLLAIDPWIDVHEPIPGLDLGVTFPRFVRYSDIHTAIGYEKSKKIPEVRRFTQKFATEAGRDIHGEQCWTEIARRSCLKDMGAGFNVALTGTRFHAEIDIVRDLDGITIWVERPGYGPVNDHSSDNTLGPDDFDFTINNNGTLEQLGFAAAIVADDPYREDLKGVVIEAGWCRL